MINLVKRYYDRSKEIINEYQTIRHARKYASCENAVFMLGTPLHGNLGDQAITLAEMEFFSKKGLRVIEIPSPYVIPHLEKWKQIIGGKRIYIHGGGFVGTLWPEEEAMLETILETFIGNEIVILPQTVYFDKVDERVRHLNGLIKAQGNVTLCARETYSYEFARCHLNEANVILVPDMVLSANWFDNEPGNRDKVILCMRRDLEKSVTEEMMEGLKALVEKYYPDTETIYTDTVVDYMIYPHMRKRELKKKLSDLAQARLVVTDRLHGMVLAAMANAPSLVFANCNYKVQGIYNWISNNSFIAYCDDMSEAEEKIKALAKEENCVYNHDAAKEAFAPLTEIVGK